MAERRESLASVGSSGRRGSSSSNMPCVIIAVDASEVANNALNYYFEHIHKPDNLLVLLHVVELPDMSHAKQAHMTPSALYDMWMQENAKSKELEIKYREYLSKKPVKEAIFRTENGLKPGEVIVNVASELRACMVVMGTRGMGLIRRTLLDSASDYVVRHASCGIVIIPRTSDVSGTSHDVTGASHDAAQQLEMTSARRGSTVSTASRE